MDKFIIEQPTEADRRVNVWLEKADGGFRLCARAFDSASLILLEFHESGAIRRRAGIPVGRFPFNITDDGKLDITLPNPDPPTHRVGGRWNERGRNAAPRRDVVPPDRRDFGRGEQRPP